MAECWRAWNAAPATMEGGSPLQTRSPDGLSNTRDTFSGARRPFEPHIVWARQSYARGQHLLQTYIHTFKQAEIHAQTDKCTHAYTVVYKLCYRTVEKGSSRRETSWIPKKRFSFWNMWPSWGKGGIRWRAWNAAPATMEGGSPVQTRYRYTFFSYSPFSPGRSHISERENRFFGIQEVSSIIGFHRPVLVWYQTVF